MANSQLENRLFFHFPLEKTKDVWYHYIKGCLYHTYLTTNRYLSVYVRWLIKGEVDFMAKYKYTELSNWIREKIIQREFAAGDRIPTELELSKTFSLSRDTVRQAIGVLEEEGLLERKKGSGTYVIEQKINSQLLSSGVKKGTIGVVLNELNDYIFPSIARGIDQVLKQHGYAMKMQFTSNQISMERDILQSVLTDEYAGLIIEPTKSALPPVNKDLYERMAQEKPSVLIHAKMNEVNISSITMGDERAGKYMTNFLIENGHRNIGFIYKFDEQTGTNRYLGSLKALQQNNLPINDEHICWFLSEELPTLFQKNIPERVERILQECTAVMCQDDRVAANLITYLKNKNIRVPEDISVVGFDDSDVAEVYNITTINHLKEQFGAYVAEKLISKIENPSLDISYDFSPKIINRKTVRGIATQKHQA